jgi:hypothetical protein
MGHEEHLQCFAWGSLPHSSTNNMKIKFIKTHWFRGVPFLWNTQHTSQGKTAKIFRFGPVLIRVEK